MTVEDLETLYDYNRWANNCLWPVLFQMTSEEFTRPVAGGHGSIRHTLVHMLSAEWGWLERCGGATRGPALQAREYPTVSSIVEQWGSVEAQTSAFLSTLEDAHLERVVTFALGGGVTQAMRLVDLLHHAAIHGVHHRGQVAVLLRLLGYAPGNFDILLYYANRTIGGPQFRQVTRQIESANRLRSRRF